MGLSWFIIDALLLGAFILPPRYLVLILTCPMTLSLLDLMSCHMSFLFRIGCDWIGQVPGAETLAQTAPDIGALASQALSFVASQVPHAGKTEV